MASLSRKIMIPSALLLVVIGCYATNATEDSSTPTTIYPDATPPPPTDAQKDQEVDSKTTTSRVPAKHRAVGEECNNTPLPPEPDAGVSYAFGECRVHADCTQGINGRCLVVAAGVMVSYYCSYDTCFKDSDCGEGVCECDGKSVNRCLSGDCRVDADCGRNGYCSPNFGGCPSFGIINYYCHTPEDECIDDADCGNYDGGYMGIHCSYNRDTGKWRCESPERCQT
jgi:hypothetical protein